MKRLLIIAALFSGICSARATANHIVIDDWVTVDACHIKLLLPPDLKRTKREGIDSCIAEFENRKMLLSIDYGWYGGPGRKSDITLNFQEQSISVDGKTGVLITYVDNSLYARNHPERKYVAHLYVVVKPPQNEYAPRTTSLMIDVWGQSEKELQIAERIFRGVRFESDTPNLLTYNKSLDASGVSGLLIHNLSVAQSSAAASTQPLCCFTSH